MVLAHASDVAGAWFPQTNLEAVRKATGGASAIAKGLVLVADPATGIYSVATAGSKGDFTVSVKSTTDDDARVEAAANGPVTVIADGAIKANQKVVATTGGKVIAYVPTVIPGSPGQADVEAARDEFTLVVGEYIGKTVGNVRDGTPIPDAAQNDVVIIDLNRGVS